MDSAQYETNHGEVLNLLTMLLKKCTTAFSLARRRVEDCWGDAAR